MGFLKNIFRRQKVKKEAKAKLKNKENDSINLAPSVDSGRKPKK